MAGHTVKGHALCTVISLPDPEARDMASDNVESADITAAFMNQDGQKMKRVQEGEVKRRYERTGIQ
jgi:hypothetical protein